jgi:uncharacterized protein (DUF1501 family)
MSHPPERCDGIRRREFLRLGALAPLGLTCADLFRLQAQAPVAATGSGKPPAPARACILLWLDGGPSHLDTFDPKPDAPVEVRSPFKSIPTTVPGIHLCEHLPRTARQMSHIALIRSLTHELGNHDTGSRFLLTGHRPTPALDHPSLGSVVAWHQRRSTHVLPPYIAIPGDAVGGQSNAARAGFLPGAFNAFSAGANPGNVPDLKLPEGITFERSDRRREMLARLDAFAELPEADLAVRNRDAFYDQAYRLIASPEARGAFSLDTEKPAVREAYGRSRLGTGCLLARRLVEAGSRFVTVVDHGWDTHQQIARELPDSRFPGSGKLPALDRAYSTLLADLHERGLLDSTLVVLMGEFGRTPKLNALGGRDHWPRAGFVALAGGGVRGGQVIGATNGFGEVPVDRPVSPEDLAWSLLTRMGINPATELTTPTGRPVRLLNQGTFIRELLG